MRMIGTGQNPIAEGNRVTDAAQQAGVHLRLTGGIAIAKICPSARRPPLQREYSDIDFIGHSRAAGTIEEFFTELGYMPDGEFNALHGARRLYFANPEIGHEADVFLDSVRGCHDLDLRDRLDAWPDTLAPADLLLSKLQIVNTHEKDFKDVIALLADHELTTDDSGVALPRLVEVCAKDWGWWRTVTMVLRETVRVAEQIAAQHQHLAGVPTELERIIVALDLAPKSRTWKLRARVGDRVRWHSEPEEVDH